MGNWLGKSEVMEEDTKNADIPQKKTVRMVKVKSEWDDRLLKWNYYAIYPDDHNELAGLRTLYIAAKKQGYEVVFPDKPSFRLIQRPNVGGIYYEGVEIHPLSELEKRIAQEN